MNDLFSKVRKLGGIGLVLMLSGCSLLSVGESEYGCKGMPEGAKCMSTRDVYAMTNNGNVPTQVAWKKDQGGTTDPGNKAVSASAGAVQSSPGENSVVSNYVAPALPDRPVPIRTPAEVMRVWIAPWEDENGDLVVTGYLYTEIEPRRWVIGERNVSSQPTLRPLQRIEEDPSSARKSATANTNSIPMLQTPQ